MKNNANLLIGDLYEVIRLLVLKLPKMNGYIKTFKEKKNKLMTLRIDDDKLLEKYKTIWTKIEDLEIIELNALPVNHDIKNKTRSYGI